MTANRNSDGLRTGIYQRRTRKRIPLTPDNTAEYCERIQTAVPTYLDDCEAMARKILAAYVVPMFTTGSTTLATRQGPLTVALPSDSQATEMTPRARVEACRARDAVEVICAVLRVDRCRGDSQLAAMNKLGRGVERLKVRPFEPLVKRARENEKARMDGVKRLYDTDKRIAIVKKYRREHPKMSKTALVKLIEKETAAVGVRIPERTIWNYLKKIHCND